jgi:hypothetical protein
MLESYWESVDGQCKTVQIDLLQSKVKDILDNIYGGSSAEHLGVNKTTEIFRRWYYWLHARSDIEGGANASPVQLALIPEF